MVVCINKYFSEKRNIPNVVVISAFFELWQEVLTHLPIFDTTTYWVNAPLRGCLIIYPKVFQNKFTLTIHFHIFHNHF